MHLSEHSAQPGFVALGNGFPIRRSKHRFAAKWTCVFFGADKILAGRVCSRMCSKSAPGTLNHSSEVDQRSCGFRSELGAKRRLACIHSLPLVFRRHSAISSRAGKSNIISAAGLRRKGRPMSPFLCPHGSVFMRFFFSVHRVSVKWSVERRSRRQTPCC